MIWRARCAERMTSRYLESMFSILFISIGSEIISISRLPPCFTALLLFDKSILDPRVVQLSHLRPFGDNDGFEFLECLFEVIVHNEIIILAIIPDLLPRPFEAPSNLLWRVRLALQEPCPKRLWRGREDVDIHPFRVLLFELHGPLGIDVEDHVDPLIEFFHQEVAGGSIEVPMDLRPLHKLVSVFFPLEGRRVDKEIIFAMDLPRSGRPGRERNRTLQVCDDFGHLLTKAGLSGP